MPIKASPTRAIQEKPVGELLWLAVTAVEFVVIMGIVCWPLSAQLLPRLAANVASGSRDVSIAPVPTTSASPSADPSSTYSINRLPLPDLSPLSADQAFEGSSGGGLMLALRTQAAASGVQPSPRDSGGPAAAVRRSQQTRSDSATRKKTAAPSRAAPTLTPPTARDSGW